MKTHIATKREQQAKPTFRLTTERVVLCSDTVVTLRKVTSTNTNNSSQQLKRQQSACAHTLPLFLPLSPCSLPLSLSDSLALALTLLNAKVPTMHRRPFEVFSPSPEPESAVEEAV